MGQGQLKSSEQDRLVAAAAALPPGPVRDLFEGYLPSSEKGERKLGSNPRPRAILSLKGEAGHGETTAVSAHSPGGARRLSAP